MLGHDMARFHDLSAQRNAPMAKFLFISSVVFLCGLGFSVWSPQEAVQTPRDAREDWSEPSKKQLVQVQRLFCAAGRHG